MNTLVNGNAVKVCGSKRKSSNKCFECQFHKSDDQKCNKKQCSFAQQILKLLRSLTMLKSFHSLSEENNTLGLSNNGKKEMPEVEISLLRTETIKAIAKKILFVQYYMKRWSR